jgi:hypothetical protein
MNEPTIHMFAKDLVTGLRCEEHDLNIGTYNEFYLPALAGKEAWIILTDSSGVETRLHLKR